MVPEVVFSQGAEEMRGSGEATAGLTGKRNPEVASEWTCALDLIAWFSAEG